MTRVGGLLSSVFVVVELVIAVGEVDSSCFNTLHEVEGIIAVGFSFTVG